MKLKSIRVRISTGAGLCVLITALIIIYIAATSLRSNALDAATKEAVALANRQAAVIESEINKALDTAHLLAQTLSAVKDKDVRLDIDREKVMDILGIVISNNPEFAGIYTCWEPDGFDGLDLSYAGEKGHDKTGRFAPYWQRNINGKLEVKPLLAISAYSPGGKPGKWYDIPKKTMKACIIDPFEHPVEGKETLITTLTAPIIANGKFYGVVGVDLKLDFIRTMADDPDIYDKSGKMMLISNNGTLAGITGRPDIIGGHIRNVRKNYQENLTVIQKGEEVCEFMGSTLEIFSPIKVGNTNTPWSVNILIPKGNVLDTARKLMWKMIVIGIVCTGASLALLWFIAAGIARPIMNVTDIVRKIAEGKEGLTARLEVGSNDETGELANWFNVFADKLQTIIKDISNTTAVLNTSSSDLFILSGQMVSFAEKMTLQSDTVAGASEEVSANINAMASAAEEISVHIQSVSSTAEQMSQNMNAVAASIEEISFSIKEVSGSAQEGFHVAKKAMEMSDSAGVTMSDLGSAVKEIGEVTAMIKKIAEQTNLLAINAAIEAATAGDAGRGFAVVANEIKELANQSGQAAENIARRIEGVQANTEDAVKAIADISDIINKINESSMVITKSVEQQTIAASEISGNVQQANIGAGNIATSMAEIARGSNDVARSAAEAAKGVNEVSENIHGVSAPALQMPQPSMLILPQMNWQRQPHSFRKWSEGSRWKRLNCYKYYSSLRILPITLFAAHLPLRKVPGIHLKAGLYLQ
jgi:methyl-accepting chemotaxis protein